MRARMAMATMALMALALPAWALVIRGLPDSIHTVAVLTPAAVDVGRTCEVTATVINGESTHTGNELRIGATPFQDVEATPFTSIDYTATVTLAETVPIQVRLSSEPHLPPIPAYPEGRSVWSADVEVSYLCQTVVTTTTVPETTTTSAPETTTTTGPETTTTTGPETTTTTGPETTTTTVCEEDDPCWDCPTMGNEVCGPTTTIPPVTVPTESTLPFTGAGDNPVGMSLAATALVALGSFLLRAIGEGR